MSNKWDMLKEEEESMDLDLAPMLAMMVSLIPILLLSTVFVRLGILDSPLPQIVAQAIEQQKDDKDKPMVTVSISMKSGIEVVLNHLGKKQTAQVLLKEGQLDVDRLHVELINLKQKYPLAFHMDLMPGKSVPYKEIVRVMDAARKTKDGDPKLYIEDKQTNQKIETNILFVDIVFGNVMEG